MKPIPQFHPSSDGFTLTELLVTVVMSGILVAGSGIAINTLLRSNLRSQQESHMKWQLNRTLDYLNDDVRSGDQVWDHSNVTSYQDSSNQDWSDQSWVNTSANQQPILYIRAPLSVKQIDNSNNRFIIPDHGMLSGNAIMLTGNGLSNAENLTANQIYYAVNAERDQFQVASQPGGSAINLEAITSPVTVNRLIVYYTRDSTQTWYEPRTLNRAAGPCSHSPTTNCPALIDGIKQVTVNNISNHRKVELEINALLNPRDFEKGADGKTKTMTVTTFARNRPQ